MRSGAARALLAAMVLGALAGSSRGAPAAPKRPSKAAPKRAPAPPPPPLAILPSIARVKVTSYGKAVSVVQEINLPRGDWKGEDLGVYVAFGAPGPLAIDAHLVGVADGELEPEDDDRGEVLTTERAPRRPATAHPLLGRESMAGIVIHLGAAALARALTRGNMASLRVRALVEPAAPDASGASSVVVRLGASRGTPLTLGRIVATAARTAPPLTRVEARLCGPDADPHPLAVGLEPRPAARYEHAPTIAPILAVRHATDDLCVSLWLSPSKAP